VSGGDGRPHLALVGLMGAGKTTVGSEVARRLGRDFVDVDELIERTSGASVRSLFAEEGEGAFRARERVAVAEVCAASRPLVIAPGGGAIVDPENRRRLRERAVVLWLDADPATLAARVEHTDDRPLLDGGAREATLRRLTAVRAPAYEAAAHGKITTDGASVAEVADRVLEEYRSWSG